ncbi:hypothetical protein [Halocola ammonii]
MNITNYKDHPGDNRYVVYRFLMEEHADHFQTLLEERDVIFERHFDEDDDPPKILFGISKRFNKEAVHCNYLTHARYRKPMITNKFFKYTLLIFTLSVIILAFIGYFLSK